MLESNLSFLLTQFARGLLLVARRWRATAHSRAHDPTKPLWGDTAMFSIIYDNIQTGHMAEDILKDYPNLQALYKAFGAIPAVAGWIEKVKSN